MTEAAAPLQSGWRVAAGRAIGSSHLAAGTPCQDRHAVRLVGTGEDAVLVVVACDGAGSASHSDAGAESVANGIADTAEAWVQTQGVTALTEAVIRGWLADERAMLAQIAGELQVDTRELACTVVLGIVGGREAWFAQIGDGLAALRDSDGWGWVIFPMHGMYRNETVFLTSPDGLDRAEVRRIEGRIGAMAVLTDGIEALVLHYASETLTGDFFERMLVPVQASTPGISEALGEGLGRYLASDLIRSRTDDDATLVLAWRPEEPASPDVLAG